MPPIDPHQAIRDMLGNVQPLPPGHMSPISHFGITTTEIILALRYVQNKTDLLPSKPKVANQHVNRLRQMALVGLIENLERFFKELAGVCIDAIAPLTADDRLDTFRVSGSSIAGHYGADTLGRALCESGIWIDYVAEVLGAIARSCNVRVCTRLEKLLNRIHANDPTLIDTPSRKARELTNQFRLAVTIAVSTAKPST